MSKMKEYLLDQYEEKITPEIDDLIKMKEEEEGNEQSKGIYYLQ